MYFFCWDIGWDKLLNIKSNPIGDSIEKPCFITPWTFIHFLGGMTLFSVLVHYFDNLTVINAIIITLVVHTIYELKDCAYYLGLVKYSLCNSNSPLNSLGDTIGYFLGILVAKKINITKKFLIKLITFDWIIFILFVIIAVSGGWFAFVRGKDKEKRKKLS